MKKVNNGFTLIELLVVIGIIAILAAIVIVSINPAKRFQDARRSQRQANVESILNAVQQDLVDAKGELCADIPKITDIDAVADADLPVISNDPDIDSAVDLTTCLNEYLAVIPSDPQQVNPGDSSDSDPDSVYNTGYIVWKNANDQVTVAAPLAKDDDGSDIKVTR